VVDFLYNLSLAVPDLLILVGCAILFGTGGVLIARLSHKLWWSHMASDRDPARDAGDGVHNSILALIAFLMALITTNELASFGNADRQITQEALSITRLDRDLASIGADGATGRKLLRSYVESVATDEWPRLAQRPQSLSPEAEQYLNALWSEVRRLQPVVKNVNPNLGSDLAGYVGKVEEARISRYSASVNTIPDVVWLMMGVFFVSACVLAGRNKLSRYSMQVVFIQMSALGVILALDIIIDNPFGGDTSLQPDRIIAAIPHKG
jgi:hypothetical protein